MNNDLTDITILLDDSGSMSGLTDDTIGSLNKYLDDNRILPGQCRVTLVTFSTGKAYVWTGLPIASVPRITRELYKADGSSTQLIDSMVDLIDETGRRLDALPESDKPGKVIFVTLTDGIENASRRFSKSQLKERVTHQNSKYKWQFIYLGANQDAIAEAENYGISKGKAMTYAATSGGMAANFCATSNLTRSLRAASANEDLDAIAYTTADRAANDAELAKT